MRLDELTAGLVSDADGEPGASGAKNGAGGTQITGLAYDSRAVRGGELFFCVTGFERDGHDFAPRAVAAGAAALVVERSLGLGVPELLVESSRAAMAPIAARFYGDPTARLRVVGITGTNGKTTTAYLVRALLEAAGEQCGLLGTVKSVIGGEDRPTDLRSAGSQIGQRTTPEAIELQRDFSAMLDGGDRACAMEVSSHALELGRAAAIEFAGAVFTNLTQDHLDFHDTMEDYFLAKRRLFADRRPGVSVVNAGDVYGRRLAAELEGVRTFAVDADAEFSASELDCDRAGCSFTLRTPTLAPRRVRLPMPGRFNVANALGALVVVHELLGGERLDATYIAGAMGNAGLMAFTRAIGGKSTQFNVRVVGVNPGPVLTDRVEVLGRKRAATQYGDENRWRESFAKMPYGRPASTDEIAATVVFLASDLSSYTSGTIVTIDGGIANSGGMP